MLALAQIQSTAAGLIAAHSFFATAPAVAVITDNGYKDREIEAQLRTAGFVVVISPIVGAGFKGQGQSRTFTGDASFFVSVIANQQVNPTAANRDPLAGATAVMAALLDWTPGPGDRVFQLDRADALSISMLAEGLIAYDVAFTKQISIN